MTDKKPSTSREPRTGASPAPIKPAPRPKPPVELPFPPDLVIKENG